MGVGLVTILASTYAYTSYSKNYNYYYHSSYSYTNQISMPVFYAGLSLTATGLVIALTNSKKKR